MARTPRKSPIATRPIPPIGREVELTVWESPIGNYSIDLEDWQVEAIQQILGLWTDFEENTTSAFARHEVEKRLNKLGRLSIVDESYGRTEEKSTEGEPVRLPPNLPRWED